jgi:hypothetical protein
MEDLFFVYLHYNCSAAHWVIAGEPTLRIYGFWQS